MAQFHTTQRLATGLFIGLLHLGLLAALLYHVNSSRPEDAGPVAYMNLILLPKTAPPPVREATAPPPPLRRSRPSADTARPAPILKAIPAHTPADAPAEPDTPAPAPSASPSPSQKLDMLALRADVGRISKEYVAEPFEQVRAAESRLEAEKNDLGRAIGKAKRPPCTKKYSGGTSMNLILLIPLAIDTITDKGCKW